MTSENRNENRKEYFKKYYAEKRKDPEWAKQHSERCKKYNEKRKKENPELSSKRYYKQKLKMEQQGKLKEWLLAKNECWRKYYANQSHNRQKKRDLLDQYKIKTGCLNPNCSWKSDWQPYQLDFHHLDSDTKLFNIGESCYRSLTAISKEIGKCTLVCANCHRLITYGKLEIDDLQVCPPYT